MKQTSERARTVVVHETLEDDRRFQETPNLNRLQKSTHTQMRQLILHISTSKGQVGGFVGELTSAKRLSKVAAGAHGGRFKTTAASRSESQSP